MALRRITMRASQPEEPGSGPLGTPGQRLRWGLTIAVSTAVVAFGVASWSANAAPGNSPSATPSTSTTAADQPRVSNPRAAAPRATGVGSDALSASEVDRARTIAVDPALSASATDVTGAQGPEFLSSDLTGAGSAQRSGGTAGAGRQAELYFYDYTANKLVKQVVDLSTGKLAGSYSASGMQPPASQREVAKAVELLLADELGKDLRDRFAAAAGRPFTGPDQIVTTAHTYKARPSDSGAQQCGQHRCLQLIVQVAGGRYIDLNHIIVDLSGRTVARLS
ncbi:hypothetical protein QLQ12_11870 [Actinoplanes sp. NEAU-A12]|uniref:Tat pathway signal sequence domain protein n=1 Tax=Actinoplanes sandaracinus TaxID=3045177 RepID=A0ABT6WHY9_9ACTN|nr:hypothetical protein [Actinoplanes sandaracinus]MDI6099290.1 hypothetical protein [Actinoplanes sandaracinus]